MEQFVWYSTLPFWRKQLNWNALKCNRIGFTIINPNSKFSIHASKYSLGGTCCRQIRYAEVILYCYRHSVQQTQRLAGLVSPGRRCGLFARQRWRTVCKNIERLQPVSAALTMLGYQIGRQAAGPIVLGELVNHKRRCGELYRMCIE